MTMEIIHSYPSLTSGWHQEVMMLLMMIFSMIDMRIGEIDKTLI